MFKNKPTIPNGFVEIDPSGRYLRFKDILGKGAMKIVYRAFDVVLGMEVAWSQVMLNDVLCSSDELQRLYSEVHLLKSLNHQSIIRFYYSWIDIDHRTFNFITEMFTSGTLREYRQKYKQVDIRAIKNWARQILAGLVYLHSHDPPVIHRDLKCDNIFVNGHLGQVKIGDLGLAAILRGSQHAHSVIGTPEFMAPELYEEQYNELVDIYSFGMCMLEMLTSEYPYSECSNPAQIYKKVTSGKKPEAFHRVEDLEAKKFVAKCLETASKRLPACELLLDPFLAADEDQSAVSKPLLVYSPKGVLVELSSLQDVSVRRRNMTITGSVSWEDNTVFLKVQISDKDGCVRNVHFPFDIINDTSMDVAKEMVKELDITEWEPHEIAEMIEEEISALIPGLVSPKHLEQHSFDVNEDDEENHPPSLSSSSHSCQSVQETRDPNQGRQMQNNDAISESSCSMGTCSDSGYSSDKYDNNSLGRETGHRTSNTKSEKYTRFGPQETPNNGKCKEQMNSGKGNRWSGNRKLSKLRSFMDVRSQLLHRALMQAVTKRSGAKTVGAVENIGYNDPC